MSTRRRFLIIAAAAAGASLLSAPAMARKAEIYTGFLSSAAVGGYDPVAYFTQGRPVKGKGKWTMSWKGANWYFASRENLETFRAMPEKYAPQFGGYCAYGVSQGAAVKGDPLLWTIRDGRLYLNINKQVQKIWEKDIPGYIEKAEMNWPKVLE